MERLEAFEKMLADLIERAESEKLQMNKLRSEGKERSATYRQLMGNRLMYVNILLLYEEYGLIEKQRKTSKEYE